MRRGAALQASATGGGLTALREQRDVKQRHESAMADQAKRQRLLGHGGIPATRPTVPMASAPHSSSCLLYTSDAADE